MNNKAHLRPKDFDSNGDIIPMACKVLEERPQGNLKSCEALKAYAREVLCGNNPTNSLLIRMFDEIIDNAPSVETDIEVVAKDAYEQGYADGWKERFGEPNERPQGEWIRVDDNIGTCFVCDHCGNKGHVSKFCSNCGAKMKGGAEYDK